MKKTYQAPCVEVTKIGATQMMCASPFINELGTNEKNGSAALGRERGSRTESDDFDGLW